MVHVNPERASRRCRIRIALAASIALGLCGCSWSPWPGGFWSGHHPACVVERSSDQGPWGGTRTIRWNACGSARFSRDDARRFAERHGWKLIDEVDVDAAMRDAEAGRPHPRFMNVPSSVLRFDSGWVREAPGTGETSVAVGYVQIARDGSAMYLFHFWGNG